LEGSAYWIDDETFVKVVQACLENLARAGFKVVVAHGHGPSTRAFRDHLAVWEVHFDLRLLHLQNELGDHGLGFMSDHAATNETSLMMALHPEWVDLTAIADQEPLVGIWGTDPRTHASAELGNQIIRAQIEWLRDRLTGFGILAPNL
jgi:creatinine amidohydrolase